MAALAAAYLQGHGFNDDFSLWVRRIRYEGLKSVLQDLRNNCVEPAGFDLYGEKLLDMVFAHFLSDNIQKALGQRHFMHILIRMSFFKMMYQYLSNIVLVVLHDTGSVCIKFF